MSAAPEVDLTSTFIVSDFIRGVLSTGGYPRFEDELATLARAAWEEIRDGTTVILTAEERQQLNEIRRHRYLHFVVQNLLYNSSLRSMSAGRSSDSPLAEQSETPRPPPAGWRRLRARATPFPLLRSVRGDGAGAVGPEGTASSGVPPLAPSPNRPR